MESNNYLSTQERELIKILIGQNESLMQQEILSAQLYEGEIQYAIAQGALEADLQTIRNRHEYRLCDLKKQSLEFQQKSLEIRIAALKRFLGNEYTKAAFLLKLEN